MTVGPDEEQRIPWSSTASLPPDELGKLNQLSLLQVSNDTRSGGDLDTPTERIFFFFFSLRRRLSPTKSSDSWLDLNAG